MTNEEFIETVFDIITNETIVKPLSKNEIDAIKLEREKNAEILKEINDQNKLKDAAKSKLLALGLTEVEISALYG